MLANYPAAMDAIIKKQPVGSLGGAEEVGAAVLFLCSNAASFIVVWLCHSRRLYRNLNACSPALGGRPPTRRSSFQQRIRLRAVVVPLKSLSKLIQGPIRVVKRCSGMTAYSRADAWIWLSDRNNRPCSLRN